VALIKFASRTLSVKVHLKKNPEAEKLDSVRQGIKFPMLSDTVEFLLITGFFRGEPKINNKVGRPGVGCVTFGGRARVRCLFVSEFYNFKILRWYLQNTHTLPNTPFQI
jgi:hypothetical protein